MSTCRSCGAPVRFAKAASGKWMILDAEPSMDGNIILALDDRERHANAIVFRDAAAAQERFGDRRRYKDHHATCPQAREWRGQ
jgi:hypothetical protein